jgi:hypothetical protein
MSSSEAIWGRSPVHLKRTVLFSRNSSAIVREFGKKPAELLALANTARQGALAHSLGRGLHETTSLRGLVYQYICQFSWLGLIGELVRDSNGANRYQLIRKLLQVVERSRECSVLPASVRSGCHRVSTVRLVRVFRCHTRTRDPVSRRDEAANMERQRMHVHRPRHKSVVVISQGSMLALSALIG